MDYKKIFETFNQQKVMIVGDVMVDAYLWGHVERISPEAPVPVVSVDKRANRLGGAANVALNVKALGATPIPCAIIGKDTRGDEFRGLLEKRNITDDGIITSKYRSTTTKFRIIGNNTQMLRVDEETTYDLNTEEQNLFVENCEKMINQHNPDVIIFEDYDKGLITVEVIDKITALANEAKIPVVADPKKKNFLNYKGLSLFKPNLKELKEGLNLNELNTFDKIEKAIFKLQDQQTHELVMVTLSDKGVMISDGTEIIRLPAHYRSIADVSGAGDTVIGTLALCLAQNLAIRDIAAISNLAGGLVCEHVGVVPVNKEKLLREALRLL
ncbi:MAG: bifunctional heptose 7-phosphate kinase/heptose 1-phosphate adenyltransferase [Bacteroidota bacterium]